MQNCDFETAYSFFSIAKRVCRDRLKQLYKYYDFQECLAHCIPVIKRKGQVLCVVVEQQ